VNVWGSSAIAIPADVTDASAMEQVAKAAIKQNGYIDVWVNNAGVLAAGPFSETPVQVHNRVIQINLIGYMHGAYAVLPYFKKQQYGILINNISVGGWFPTPYAVGYSASKFGLRGFSESLRGELSKWKNIHVCDIFPAFLDTPGIQHAANYTNVVLKPAPPVYNPQKVAKTIVYLSQHPKNATTIGSVATILRLFHFLLPTLTCSITARVIEKYLKNAELITATTGNLFQPVEYGTSIHGGWTVPKRSRASAAIPILLASMLAGFLATRKALR